MECRIIDTTEEFVALKEEWERIEALSEHTTYFSTFHYNYTWWDLNQTNTDYKLFILVVYNNNTIVGIAPLKLNKIKRRFHSYIVLEFLTHGDYADLLIDISTNIHPRKIAGKIFEKIEEYNTIWDEFNLTHISQHTLIAEYIFTSKFNRNFDYLIEVPYINFSKFVSFDDYTKSFLPKKIKQYINRLQREVNYEMIVTNDNVLEQLSEIHVAEKNYLLSKGLVDRHSLFEDEKKNEFLKSLYTCNDNVLTYLLLDAQNNYQVMCYYTGYVYKNVYHSYNTAYNPKYQHLAVGKIFNYLIFESNQKEKRWEIFDMGTGRYSWKFEWTNTFNLLYQLKVVNQRNKQMIFLEKLEKLLSATKQLFRK